jgi:branched-chain amino acid transport system ATP-binding protein
MGYRRNRAPGHRLCARGPGDLCEELTVQEHLAMGAYTRRDARGSRDMEQVFAYFPVLAERTNQWAGTLSGGEQQMLAIGRALMLDPRLLILDEPSLGLSPILVRKFFPSSGRSTKEGHTILLVEQNARMALSISHTGLILENGRFVMKGRQRICCRTRMSRSSIMGVKSEASVKGYQRWKRKKAWR